MTVVVTHTTPADGTFSATGAAAWNADHTLSGVGTLAEQNANAVDITGGTINGATVGATTPAAGTFTTLTGQTANLTGTGQNLYTQSNTFSNIVWTQTGVTVSTTVATTDPFGASNAWKSIAGNGVVLTGNDSTGALVRTASNSASYPVTFTIYAKAAEISSVRIRESSETGNRVLIDLTTGVVVYEAGTSAQVTYVVTDVGNGWWRIAATRTPTSAINYNIKQGGATGDGTSGIYLFGAQFEIGSTAGTYIPTTTTAVYGTPTLSFSGVSTLGLESNGSLFLQPAGTGALQADATTSSAVGGNARGANAVDWLTSRSGAGQVASGALSVISGGNRNTASGIVAFVGGGTDQVSSGSNAFVGGGQANTASGAYAGIASGRGHTAAGVYNFIGGGFTNSGTANAAVTTQSGTMNGTTAVTLSGSNASIRVGQNVSGTSIPLDTYVAAISGTSLTLSQAASGSSTSTLSFFTPHGVVVGGGNNQATGAYSFIGGGGDAGTAANRNVASGDWSFVGGGTKNIASGVASTIGGGGSDGATALGNTASGTGATIVGGVDNQAGGLYSVTGGRGNIADGNRSTAFGASAWTRAIRGNIALSACQNPIGGSGVSQSCLLILGKETTNATATVITSNGAAASSDNQVILPNNSAYTFRGEIVAGVTGGGNSKSWTIEGLIKRGAGVGTTVLVGSTVTSMYADVGAATWTIALSADTTNGGLAVTFTGQASTIIRCVAQIRTTEMTF